MVAEIYLPNGCPAFLDDEEGWHSPNPEVILVLNYLTKQIKGDVATMNVAEIAHAVVGMMRGARFLWTNVPEFRPSVAEKQGQAVIVDKISVVSRRLQQGRKDRWVQLGGTVYTGRLYPRGTEILTTGLTRLHKDPVAFARDDPEYFSFGVKTLRKW